MSNDLVLLTGGTGFLGYSILVELLKSGYKVRVAARSQSKVDQVLAAPSIKSMSPSAENLTFVIVPDMAANGAYDDAVKSVRYIIHTAAALPNFKGPQREDSFLEAFVADSKKAVLNLLESAKTYGGGLQRIVMTSSTVAIVPTKAFLGDIEACEPVYGPGSRIPVSAPPYANENEAYCVSKTASLNASEDFMKRERPTFDLISIMPSWIFGMDDRATTLNDLSAGPSNAMVTDVLLGSKKPYGLANTAVLCSDVAKAHVKALDRAVSGNQSFVVSVPFQWDAVIPSAKRLYPEAFDSGLFREDGKQSGIPLKFDTSTTKTILGLELEPSETILKEIAGQYIELSGRGSTA